MSNSPTVASPRSLSCFRRSLRQEVATAAATMYHLVLVGAVLLAYIQSGETVFRCSRHTESAWHSYLHGRVDEGSAYDCPAGSSGGQCVALLKCKCGLPWTGAWQADIKISDVCGPHAHHSLAAGTAIATFDSHSAHYGNRWTDHAAVFLGCTSSHGVKVVEQGCSIAIRTHVYSSSASHYKRFYSVKCRSGTSCSGYPSSHCKVHLGK